MKKIFLVLVILTAFISCDSGNTRSNNPNLPNYLVNESLNLNLPQYSQLQFAGNAVIINAGISGIVVTNTGNSYTAFDLACPNQQFGSCPSAMSLVGLNAYCACDESTYSLFTGLGQGQQYPMKQYRAELNGNIVYITN
ncbi:hypothetical protein [Flavobacterium sp.]